MAFWVLMARREYTDTDVAAAISWYEASGNKLRETARKFGVPVPTLQKWVRRDRRPVDVSVVDTVKKELADMAEDFLRSLLPKMESCAEDAPLKDQAVAFGIVSEKMQLLRGKPTGINEHVGAREERVDRVAEELARLGLRPTGSDTGAIVHAELGSA